MVMTDPESKNGITYKPRLVIRTPEMMEKSALCVNLCPQEAGM